MADWRNTVNKAGEQMNLGIRGADFLLLMFFFFDVFLSVFCLALLGFINICNFVPSSLIIAACS